LSKDTLFLNEARKEKQGFIFKNIGIPTKNRALRVPPQGGSINLRALERGNVPQSRNVKSPSALINIRKCSFLRGRAMLPFARRASCLAGIKTLRKNPSI